MSDINLTINSGNEYNVTQNNNGNSYTVTVDQRTSGSSLAATYNSIKLPTSNPLGGHRVLVQINDILEYADKDNPSHEGLIVGMSLEAVSSGNITIVTNGPIEYNGWAWVEGPIYLGNNGLVTQTIPDTGFLQVIATAIAATKIIFNPQLFITLGV